MELCICYNRKLKSDHLFFPDPPNTLEKDEALVEQKYLLTIGKKEGTQSATGSFIIWLFAGTLLYFCTSFFIFHCKVELQRTFHFSLEGGMLHKSIEKRIFAWAKMWGGLSLFSTRCYRGLCHNNAEGSEYQYFRCSSHTLGDMLPSLNANNEEKIYHEGDVSCVQCRETIFGAGMATHSFSLFKQRGY